MDVRRTFGTMAAVICSRDAAHAIELAHRFRYGMAVSTWTTNMARGAAVAAEVEAGVVFGNEVVKSAPGFHSGVSDARGTVANWPTSASARRSTRWPYRSSRTVCWPLSDNHGCGIVCIYSIVIHRFVAGKSRQSIGGMSSDRGGCRSIRPGRETPRSRASAYGFGRSRNESLG